MANVRKLEDIVGSIHSLVSKMKKEAVSAEVLEDEDKFVIDDVADIKRGVKSAATGHAEHSSFLPQNKYSQSPLSSAVKDFEAKFSENKVVPQDADHYAVLESVKKLDLEFKACHDAVITGAAPDFKAVEEQVAAITGALEKLRVTPADPAVDKFVNEQQAVVKKIHEDTLQKQMLNIEKSLKAQRETNLAMLYAHEAKLVGYNTLWIKRTDVPPRDEKDPLVLAGSVALTTEEMMRRIKRMQTDREGQTFQRPGSEFSLECVGKGGVTVSPRPGSNAQFQQGVAEAIDFLKIRDKTLESVAISYPKKNNYKDVDLKEVEAFIAVATNKKLKVTEPLNPLVKEAIERASPAQKERIYQAIKNAATNYESHIKNLEQAGAGLSMDPERKLEIKQEKIDEHLQELKEAKGTRAALPDSAELKDVLGGVFDEPVLSQKASAEAKSLDERIQKIDAGFVLIDSFKAEDGAIPSELAGRVDTLLSELKSELADVKARKEVLVSEGNLQPIFERENQQNDLISILNTAQTKHESAKATLEEKVLDLESKLDSKLSVDDRKREIDLIHALPEIKELADQERLAKGSANLAAKELKEFKDKPALDPALKLNVGDMRKIGQKIDRVVAEEKKVSTALEEGEVLKPRSARI